MNPRIFLIALMLCLVISQAAVADGSTEFTLFIMDQVSLKEIMQTETPNIDYLINQGAVGLMNARTSGSLTPPDTYLTIGAGRRADGGKAANYNFNVQFDKEQIINNSFSQLIAANLEGRYSAYPGALGEKLDKAKKQVAVIGNSDYYDQNGQYQLGREAALIGINEEGRISLGDVGPKTVQIDTTYPGRVLTDHDYLLGKFKQYSSIADLIIVESGDTARIAKMRDSIPETRFNRLKKCAIKRVDKLLGQLLAEINLSQNKIMIVTPTPPRKAQQKGEKLNLTILAGSGVKHGLLTSSTTKRSGIITNLDIAPTVLTSLGIDEDSSKLIGNSINGIEAESPLTKLYHLDNRINKTFTWRPVLIKGFILLQIFTLVLAAVVILAHKRVTLRLKKITEYLLLSLLVIPIFILFFTFFVKLNIYLIIISFLLLSLGTAYLLKRSFDHELMPVLLLANLVSFLLVFDLWNNASLIKTSVLGYSPVIGARYYGLGNEFMGLLIGAVLIGVIGIFDCFCNLKQKQDYILLSIFILVVITIGHSQLGANFGGLLTSLAAFSFTYGLIKGYLFNFRKILVIIILVGLLTGSLVIYDALSPQAESTHIGRTVRLVEENGFSVIAKIAARKLSMNLKLLRWTIWTKVILAFIIILAILFRYPVGVVRNIIDDYSYLRYGFGGVICGSIVTMLVNDSGVVATATLLLYPVITLVYLVIRRIEL
ncbi:hypothetical protein [Acetohalobium arabaticum]|uniref:Alkaline phosphatase n=1 Tax=Acetohalobium arabaticum (strain ATCC 49924 / DSM 5501 / Z-7288) TaxID=574087 RepID=D9QUQ1_ACEAZ|nr:hypothetical protein [Acetohalobium arabaticum]ADL11960.1 conserved hypothetical protein [Acetohalobium arabaticum DSM 5501]